MIALALNRDRLAPKFLVLPCSFVLPVPHCHSRRLVIRESNNIMMVQRGRGPDQRWNFLSKENEQRLNNQQRNPKHFSQVFARGQSLKRYVTNGWYG